MYDRLIMHQSEQILKSHPWPSMRGNQRNTGCSMHEIESPQDALIKYYPTGNAIFSTPIIDSSERILVGSADHVFYAIDPRQNKPVWNFKTGGVIDSAGCIDSQGNVYVPSGDASIHKLSFDGKKIWELNVLEKNYSRLSTIYWWEGNITMGPNGLLYAGNDDFCLYALDAAGTVRWVFPTGLHIWSAPAFNQGLVYITSFDMCVYALRQDTGRMVWKRRLANFIAASPAIDAMGTVYITTFDGSIVALDGKTGTLLWRIKTKRSMYASVAVAPDGNLFAASGDGFVYCINAVQGTILWVSNARSALWSSPVIGADPEKKESYIIYVGTSNALIIALTPSGNRRWALRMKSHVFSRVAGVNASLALGKYGLAGATTTGDIIYIPYNSYRYQSDQFIANPDHFFEKKINEAPRLQVPKNEFTQTLILKEGDTFVMEKMEFITPAIINPFDQIGIASVSIEVGIIKSDAATGKCIAVGFAKVGLPTNHHVHQGILYPRRHTYLFSGVQQSGRFSLEAQQCDFDIMAFPIPLDYLVFEGQVLPEGEVGYSFRAVLNCRNLLIKIARVYGGEIFTYLLRVMWIVFFERKYNFWPVARTLGALFYVFSGRIWNSWGLINEENYLDAKGVFSLVSVQKTTVDTTLQKAWHDAKNRKVVAIFALPSLQKPKDYPGIILIQKNSMEVVALDYKKYFHIDYERDRIVAVLTLPHAIGVLRGIEAMILINTQVQSSIDL